MEDIATAPVIPIMRVSDAVRLGFYVDLRGFAACARGMIGKLGDMEEGEFQASLNSSYSLLNMLP